MLVIASLTNLQAQETCLPDSIVMQIVDELIIKDGMAFKLEVQDSTLRVYKQKTEHQAIEIKALKLTVGQYEQIT